MAMISIQRMTVGGLPGYRVWCPACKMGEWVALEPDAQRRIDRFDFDHHDCKKGDAK